MSQLITTIVFGTIGVLFPMYNSEILGIIVLEDITYSLIFLFVLLDILLIFFF